MQTATQTLHRLTSYTTWEESSGWDPPADDPRVVRSFEPNDLSRLPWFYKRYPSSLPVLPLPRSLPATTAPAVAVLAGTADVAPAALDLPGLSPLLPLSALVVTGIPWRTGWRYRERGYRHVYWDAGSMLAQTLAVADSAGLGPHLYSYF